MYYIIKSKSEYDIVDEDELEYLDAGWSVWKGPYKTYEDAVLSCPAEVLA